MEDQNPKGKKETGGPPKAPPREPTPPAVPDPPVSGPLGALEAWLYGMLFVRAPFHLPLTTKDWLVRFWPWIIVAGGVLMVLAILPALFAALTLTSMMGTYGGYYGTMMGAAVGPAFYLSFILYAIEVIVMFVAVPLLLRRQRLGWQLAFYVAIALPIYAVISLFSYGYFDIVGFILQLFAAVIGLYFLFQIRSYYTGMAHGYKKHA